MLALEKLKLKIGDDIGVFVSNCPEFGLDIMPAHANDELRIQTKQVVRMLEKMIRNPKYKGNVIENKPIIINKEAF